VASRSRTGSQERLWLDPGLAVAAAISLVISR
jgi:hypothetical protein